MGQDRKSEAIFKAGMQNKITSSIDHRLLSTFQSPGHTDSQLECRRKVDNGDKTLGGYYGWVRYYLSMSHINSPNPDRNPGGQYCHRSFLEEAAGRLSK